MKIKTNDMAFQAIDNACLSGSSIIGWFNLLLDGRDEDECFSCMYANTMDMISHLSIAMCAVDYDDEFNEIEEMHGVMAVCPEYTSESTLEVIGEYVERLGQMLGGYENPYTRDDNDVHACPTCLVQAFEHGSIIPDELHDQIDWSDIDWHWVEAA